MLGLSSCRDNSCIFTMCFINGNQCQVSLEQSGSKYVPPWGCFTSVSNGYSNWIGLWKVLVCPSPEGTPSIAALTLPSRPFISCFTLACRQKVLGFSSCRNPETRWYFFSQNRVLFLSVVRVISVHTSKHTLSSVSAIRIFFELRSFTPLPPKVLDSSSCKRDT